jgi:hypothetical protein
VLPLPPDAPDLNAPTASSSEAEKPAPKKHGRLNGGQEHSSQQSPAGRGVKAASDKFKPILDPEPSAVLRDQLAAELGEINSTEEAANWAHRVLGAKNSLTAADAACIEEAFRAKLAVFATDTADGPAIPQETERPRAHPRTHRSRKQRRLTAIDKSALGLPEPRRVRDREHVRYVTQQSCLICGRRPSDAHHLRFVQSRALSRKVSDEFTVPLCRGHHREVHRCGDEAIWWKKTGIDPTVPARALWLESHPLPTASSDDQSRAEPDRRIGRGPSDKTKPIIEVGPQ